ncbi:MAG: hypothetical protein JST04_14295 [Bdellovibrionales bacterium]|nr:hypothetical protein [Bdellovibrionales bacterium]
MTIRPLVLAGLALFAFGSALASPPVALKYAENGNWYVHVVKMDGEGFPDTVEKRAYPTEGEADARIRELASRSGTVEKDSVPSGDPTHELRGTMAGEIWTATEEWSTDWEDKFADWTRANFDAKFFKRYKIKTDCADAAVALRWIFSRIMGLPAGNRLDWGGGLMTNRSVRAAWANLPTATNWYEDKRFLAALDYILVNTYTHSVHADSYPIEITPQFLREGAFHLELRTEDGHTRVFTNITRDPYSWPLEDMWSNVPRKVRKLEVEPFTVYQQPPMKFGGILRHRWTRLTAASAYLVPAEQMPGYSLEQYQPDFFQHGTYDYSAEVAARIRASTDPVIGLESVLKNLNQAIDDRKTLVEDGFKVCSAADCSPGTQNYEDWSSPSRDARLGGYFDQVDGYLASLHGDDLDRAKDVLKSERKKNLLKFDGKKYRYDDVAAVWKAKKYSSDPRDPPATRWGFSN